MRYLDWNNIIASYFFNSQNAGKDIHLYITKKEIINLGRPFFNGTEDNEIWKDFLTGIKNGIIGSEGNITSRAAYAFKKRDFLRIEGCNIKYPPYITYLVFFVLPLIEEDSEEYNTNNYFGRLNSFLEKNKIRQKIGTSDFRDNDINSLWVSLSQWSRIKMNGDLGSFTIKPFINFHWVYVGKIFSQCVLTPASIKKFPEFFLTAGMIPDSFYSAAELKKNLLEFGPRYYGSNIIDLIRKSDTNELGQSIIEIANREYGKWTGESHQIILTGTNETAKRNYTVAPLLLQFNVNEIEGTIKFSFRIFSSNDYPEDLKFRNFENIYESHGFSKTLELPEKNSLNPFDLQDTFNKWLARFPKKDVRIFINGGIFQLSTGYWIETDILSKTDWMFLLCKNEKKKSILEWGKHFKVGNFFEEDLEGLPENYSLFKILNPTESHPDIPLLTIFTEKNIKLVGGLKVNFRTFFSDYLPDVEVTNSDGNERVFLQYRNTDEQIFLQKKQSNSNRWLLPDNVLLNKDFYVRIIGEALSGNETAYAIMSAYESAGKIDEQLLPKRDSYGRKVQKDLLSYLIGSNVIGIEWKRQEADKHYFTGINESFYENITSPKYINHEGNKLLSFLTLKKISTTEDFYSAFEFLYSKHLEKGPQNNINYSKLKKSSINFYDYLGYLDYDYEEKQIVVNPPQLIFIPVSKGRKVLLIGGRDNELVNSIIGIAPKYNLQVEITKQFSSNENLLLPDAITIESFGRRTENFGEKNLLSLAEELKIEFNPAEIIQFGLQSLSADIVEYEQELLSNNQTSEDDYNWARLVFNVEALEYEKSESSSFDKSFSLIEYKLNEYTFYNKLWKEGKCYRVDKNWGKFLALKHYNKQVILYNKKYLKVAIPVELPLPRLLAKSIILLSGLAPVYTKINSRAYRVYENIPSTFIKNLFDKLKQTTIDFNF